MRPNGYTLIEILITIALISILAFAAIPITGQWIKGAKVEETGAQLIEALGRAKASGLRNTAGKTSTGVVAKVCIDTTNDTLKVMESTSSTEAGCSAGTQLWQATLDSNITVSNSSSSAISCLCTNNKGQLIDAGSCSSCYTGETVYIKSGLQESVIPIF